MNKIIVAALLALAASSGAAGEAESGEKVFSLLKQLVNSGQRYAGAPRRGQAIERLAGLLSRRGLSVERDSFVARDPRDGAKRPMTNVIGRFRPKSTCRLLLGTHFDVRHVAEEDADVSRRGRPIPGANDGSSGVAVLVDLAGRLKDILPPGVGADVALFDGEEMGYPGIGGYCLGSQHYASGPMALRPKPKFGIILDMVCDDKGVYLKERNSFSAAPGLVDALWEEGNRRLPEAFDPNAGLTVGDDHVSLIKAGVPSLLIIGFNYPQWHTSGDTLERCSARRLAEMEEVLAGFLRNRSGEFLKCASEAK